MKAYRKVIKHRFLVEYYGPKGIEYPRITYVEAEHEAAAMKAVEAMHFEGTHTALRAEAVAGTERLVRV